ncbi:MAG TPA: hypothetical protein PLP33_22425 [Leptospiraceae bacterium]|nr:hypothetical protein [Leptospiraceae bacterium]HNC58204.1 hypothetical protein [Leptospiraceae bacterium]HNK94292.1 hypothetical protein [Leptospiraceae bacterium]HNL73917.1 hypothetical protein [Leptospiraceae bacterium]
MEKFDSPLILNFVYPVEFDLVDSVKLDAKKIGKIRFNDIIQVSEREIFQIEKDNVKSEKFFLKVNCSEKINCIWNNVYIDLGKYTLINNKIKSDHYLIGELLTKEEFDKEVSIRNWILDPKKEFPSEINIKKVEDYLSFIENFQDRIITENEIKLVLHALKFPEKVKDINRLRILANKYPIIQNVFKKFFENPEEKDSWNKTILNKLNIEGVKPMTAIDIITDTSKFNELFSNSWSTLSNKFNSQKKVFYFQEYYLKAVLYGSNEFEVIKSSGNLITKEIQLSIEILDKVNLKINDTIFELQEIESIPESNGITFKLKTNEEEILLKSTNRIPEYFIKETIIGKKTFVSTLPSIETIFEQNNYAKALLLVFIKEADTYSNMEFTKQKKFSVIWQILLNHPEKKRFKYGSKNITVLDNHYGCGDIGCDSKDITCFSESHGKLHLSYTSNEIYNDNPRVHLTFGDQSTEDAVICNRYINYNSEK